MELVAKYLAAVGVEEDKTFPELSVVRIISLPNPEKVIVEEVDVMFPPTKRLEEM